MSRSNASTASVSRALARSAAALAIAVAAVPVARAAGAGGYVTTSSGAAVTDGSGECWHTGEWRAGMRLGRCEPAVAAAPAPAHPVLAAARAKAPPARPAAPAPARISADTLFEFDSAALTAQGRGTLDGLARRIDASPYGRIAVVGHADRLGTPGYNLALSERRAQAVSAYLGERGLAADRIHATGAGSSAPRTSASQCKGLARPALIRCLQPDRYVEITAMPAALSASSK